MCEYIDMKSFGLCAVFYGVHVWYYYQDHLYMYACIEFLDLEHSLLQQKSIEAG